MNNSLLPNRRFMMTDSLMKLLKSAQNIKMSPLEKEEQRQSFAYGNTNIENSKITKSLIEKQAKALAKN